jgi:DsbC/DsbD-like thiol-disulfide interchange protein
MRLLLLALTVSSLIGGVGQPKVPRAELTPNVETSPVLAGASVDLSVDVHLPEDVHVQSDKPRDRSLIPTVLTLDAPAGVTVDRIAYPPPADLAQEGRTEPLAVFGPEFTIRVRISVAASVSAGDLIVPAHLRYQACDAKLCYPPARSDMKWVLHIERR